MKKFITTLFIISLATCSSTGGSDSKKKADEFSKTQDFKDLVAAREIINETPRKRQLITLSFRESREKRECNNIIQNYLDMENQVIVRKASGSEALKIAKQYKKECSNK